MLYRSIDHFREYRETVDQIEEIEYKLEPLKRKLFNAKSPSLSDVHYTQPKDVTLVLIAKKDILENKLAKLKEKERSLYEKHIEEIAKVENKQYRRILRSIYLLGMSYEQLADIMNTSVDNIRMMKSRADKEFASVMNCYEML